MQFPSSYFEDEVRDGFYVPGIIKRAWAAQLEVLADIAEVCRRHDIRWYADCGTLLGAVRHGGFIPWDDDLDICMMRDDYIRFNWIAREELPSNYFVMNFHTVDDFWELLTRVVNGNRINLDQDHLEKYHDFPYATGIDIFPVDYLAPDDEEETLRKDLAQMVLGTANEINWDEPFSEETKADLHKIEETCNISLDWGKPMKRQLYTLGEQLFSLYTREEAEYVALMPYWIEDGNHKYPLQLFESFVMLPFETTEIPAPAAYDAVLRIEYGNYMIPNHHGGLHDYPFYKKQEKQLADLLGITPFQYIFSETDLEREDGNMQVGELKQEIEKFIEMMRQAHDAIRKAYLVRMNDAAKEIIENCQNGAISIGTLIERYEGEDDASVRILEEYCEQLYQMHEMLDTSDISLDSACAKLDVLLSDFEGSIPENFKMRKEIVFLPYKAAMWDSLESVWKAAVDDPDCNVYVIPIPYYDRNVDGSLREMHYEGDLYPEYVPVTHYSEYDFAMRRPDVIFIHNPYDECNHVTSVEPAFYSKNLKNYTDQLIYIPYFVLDEIDPEDQRAVQSMQHFVTVPGVIHADKVIVQSEKMRQAYIDVLADFAGEHTRPIWEKKILGLGSPKYDKVLSASKETVMMPEGWRRCMRKEDGSYKKVILYNTTISPMLEHKEVMLEKIRYALSVFEKNQEEITLLWRPHPLIEATLASMRPQLWEEYRKIVEQYRVDGWGIFDDSADLNRAIAVSDAYYGDPSSVVQLCKRAGMPVMLQNVEVMDLNH